MKSYKNLLLLPLFIGYTATARQKPNILYVFADQFSWEKQGWRGIRTLTQTFVISRNKGVKMFIFTI